MIIRANPHMQATQRVERAILTELLRVSPREAEDGARATGFGSERYQEGLDQALLARLNGRSRSAAAAVLAHRRRKRAQEESDAPPPQPQVFIPQGWLVADHTLLSHQQMEFEQHDAADTVELSKKTPTAVSFSLEDPSIGWLLAPGTPAFAA